MEPVQGGKEAGEGAEELLRGRAVPRPDSLNDNPKECPVCLNEFNENELRPRNLPCGHTFCSPCIVGLMGRGQLVCPTCRGQHFASDASHFPVNYVLESMMKRMQGAEMPPKSSAPQSFVPQPSAPPLYFGASAGISKKLQSLLQAQKNSVYSVISKCQQFRSQLDKYCSQVARWQEQHQELEDTLSFLLQQNKAARELLHGEDFRAVTIKERVSQAEHRLRLMVDGLENPSVAQEADAAIDSADRSSIETEEWLQECQETFPDMRALATSRKVRETTGVALDTAKVALEKATLEAGASSVHRPLVDPAATVMEKVQTFIRKSRTLEAEDLRCMAQHAMRLVEAGQVFAVHDDGGERRYSKITLQDCRLYLHSLLPQEPHPRAFTIQMSEVVTPSPPCLVFLDLAWPGSPRRRVHIRLGLDAPRSRQFLLLCTGQRGPSYANTKLFYVARKGEPGEGVFGGDYQTNNGQGAAALLSDEEESHYLISGRAGAVGAWSEGKKGAQFTITTRAREPGKVFGKYIGEVESGLDVVVQAANQANIKSVTVVDCGVVLWR